ncbi:MULTISPECIES: basic secretory protein-like protein [unclassified Pseudoalteromonas]|uniref:basic secretory protein-like protein n=1 Tax=unclassified Pseudoalteromonas TaxID=194690 RepID=UPI0005AA3AB8|nr:MULTISPECIES: basic secretory protein-like protein [unclassified Pseudoalteromonas]
MNKQILLSAILPLIFLGCGQLNRDETPTVLKKLPLDKGDYSSQFPDEIPGEGLAQLFDHSLKSKYLSKQPHAWVQYQSNQPQVVKQYQLTSATDAPMRDPHEWVLMASNDEKSWQVLDKIDGHIFSKRSQTSTFDIDNDKGFKYFRLDMQQRGKTVHGDHYLQLADFSLNALTKLPIAKVKFDRTKVSVGESISIKSISENTPTKHLWTVEGADIKFSGENVLVTFNQPGSYDVKLVTENQHGTDTLIKKNVIKVLDKKSPWNGFKPPKVVLTYEDTQSEGYKRLIKLFPHFDQQINQVTQQLVKRLYKDFTQIPEFEQVEFQLKWMDTLAYRSGDETNMVIAFSSKYITEKLKNADDDTVKYELLGVLWHELTHGYQLFPKNREYGADEDVHAFIEGVADLIRIDAGFHKTREPKQSDSWLGGYTNTGFFLHWIKENKNNDFAYKFNQSANSLNNWSFEKAVESITGESIESLWREYQQSLVTGTS